MLQGVGLVGSLCAALVFMFLLLAVFGGLNFGDPAVWLAGAAIGFLVAVTALEVRSRRRLPRAIGTAADAFAFRYRDRIETIEMEDIKSVERGFVIWRGQAANFTMADGTEQVVQGIHWYQVDRMEGALRVFQRAAEARRRHESACVGIKVAEAVVWQPLRLSNATRNTAWVCGALAGLAAAWAAWSVSRWGSFPVGSVLLALFLATLAWGLRRQARKVPHAFAVTDGALSFELPGGRESIPMGEIANLRQFQIYRNQGSLEIERRDGRKQQFLSIPRGKLQEILGEVKQARARGNGDAGKNERGPPSA